MVPRWQQALLAVAVVFVAGVLPVGGAQTEPSSASSLPAAAERPAAADEGTLLPSADAVRDDATSRQVDDGDGGGDEDDGDRGGDGDDGGDGDGDDDDERAGDGDGERTLMRLVVSRDRVSFDEPIRIWGRLVSQYADPLENRTVTVRTPEGDERVVTDERGVFIVEYRPRTAPVGRTTVSAEYRSNNTSVYLDSNASRTVVVEQVTPTVELTDVTGSVGFGGTVDVAGRISAGGVTATGVPVEIEIGGVTVERVETDAEGAFQVSESLPASVAAGDASVVARVGGEDSALAPTSATTPLTVESTAPVVDAAADRTAVDEARVSGRVQVNGDPVPDRPLVVRRDGVVVAQGRTDESGEFEEVVSLNDLAPGASASLTVAVEGGPNLEATETTVDVPAAAESTGTAPTTQPPDAGGVGGDGGDGGDGADGGGENGEVADGGWLDVPGLVVPGLTGPLAWLAAAALVLVGGVGLLLLRSRFGAPDDGATDSAGTTGADEPTDSTAATRPPGTADADGTSDPDWRAASTTAPETAEPNSDSGVESSVTGSSRPNRGQVMLRQARNRLETGRPNETVALAYGAVRQHLVARLDLPQTTTPGDVVAAARERLEPHQAHTLERLTEAYERTEFGSFENTEESAREAVMWASWLVGGAESTSTDRRQSDPRDD